jgi:hypothetical protein
MKDIQKLKSVLGSIFVIIIYVLTIGFLFLILFFIVTKNFSGVIVSLTALLLLYFKFHKSIRKFKDITFDSNFIYFDDELIPLTNIIDIKKGKIIYIEKGIKKMVFYNYYFSLKYNVLINSVKK